MSPPRNYSVDNIRSKFATVALDNTYQVEFNLNNFLITKAQQANIDSSFLVEDLGLYVSDAVLPGSSFGDIEVAGDRQGITERNAFSRIYDDITLTFYVDREYKVLRFFEIWNQAVNPLFGSARNSAVMKFSYPNDYKCDFTIHKFNKDKFLGDIAGNIETSDVLKRGTLSTYKMLRAWPYSVASTPVNYDGQNVLKLNVTFRYDRYQLTGVTQLKYYPGYLDGASYVYFVELTRPNGETYQVPVQDGRPTLAQLAEVLEANKDVFTGPNILGP